MTAYIRKSATIFIVSVLHLDHDRTSPGEANQRDRVLSSP